MTVRFDVREVNPSDGAIVSTLTGSEGTVLVANVGRVASQVFYDDFFGLPVGPTVVRAGNSVTLNNWQVADGAFGPTVPTGTVSVAVDGVPAPVWYTALGLDTESAMAVPVDPVTGILPILVYDVPGSTSVGPHTVTVTYAGDALFLPSSNSYTFTVVAQRDALYDCVAPARHLTASPRCGPSRLPPPSRMAARPCSGTSTSSSSSSRSDRTGTILSQLTDTTTTPLGATNSSGGILDAVGLGFGDATGTVQSSTRTGGTQFRRATPSPTCWSTSRASLRSCRSRATENSVPIDLDRLELDGRSIFGGVYAVSCVPTDAAIRLGTITIAGTTLAVEGPSPLRADDDITLRAAVAPSTATGQVEFSDDGDIIAISPITNGQAVASVTLAEGEHTLTARTRAGASAPSTTSDEVDVEILPAIESAAFAEEGDGAVVRLVYMELLGRCPEQAGYDWSTSSVPV